MKEADKKQPADTPVTSTDPVQPVSNDEQKAKAASTDAPEKTGDYVVVGSGLGIDE